MVEVKDGLLHASFDAETAPERKDRYEALEAAVVRPFIAAYESGDVELHEMAMLVGGLFAGLYRTAHENGWCVQCFSQYLLTRVNTALNTDRMPVLIGAAIVTAAGAAPPTKH